MSAQHCITPSDTGHIWCELCGREVEDEKAPCPRNPHSDPVECVHILGCICHRFVPQIGGACAAGAMYADTDIRFCQQDKRRHPVVDPECENLRRRLRKACADAADRPRM